jgi:predicted dehydrogenase
MAPSDRPHFELGRKLADSDDGAAPLRLGVAGCGRVFERFHAPALRTGTGWTLIAACDPDPARRARARVLAPAARAFETIEALLETCEVDAVLIAVPPALHASLALSCLSRRTHVLVEKPLALSFADGGRMVAAARNAGTLLWVGGQRRFAPYATKLATWLAGRVPHDIRTIEFETSSSPDRWGAYSGFVGDDARGGDALLDLAPHQVDLLAWFIGRQPTQVRAQPGNDGGIRYELRWQNGVTAACHVGHGTVNRDRLTIRLTDCTLVRSGPSAERFYYLSERLQAAYIRLRRAPSTALRIVTRRIDPETAGFAAQLRAFARAVRSGDRQARGSDGLVALAVIEACRSSLASGGTWCSIADVGDDGRA